MTSTLSHRLVVPFTLATAIALAACTLATPDVPSATPALFASAHADQVFERPQQITEVAEATVPAVVHIASRRAATPAMRGGMSPFFFFDGLPDGGMAPREGEGSGVLVDGPRGLVLTNNHVVEGAEELTVTLSDGRKLGARVRGTDKETDLAIVELTGDVPRDLPSLRLGDSEALRLGELVLAIGNPFGLQGSVTMGIVSAKGRADVGVAAYENFIQTDAAINPGNSGGALVNLKGELVGINTAIFSRSGGYQGIGFAIPSNMAQEIMSRLVRDGRVVRGYLGVGIQTVTQEMAPLLGLPAGTRGALVNLVSPGTAAAAAGLLEGDVVVQVDGDAITDVAQLRQIIAMKGAAQKVQLTVVRDGREKKLTATLGELPGEEPEVPSSPKDEAAVDGLGLLDLDANLRARLRLDPGVDGVLVAEVDPSSRAARAGLQPGDLILEVNRAPVKRADEVRKALKGDGPALLLVQGRRGRSYVVLE